MRALPALSGRTGVLAALMLFAAGGCAPRPAATPGLPIVASFYPLYEFARRVGDARVAVRNLVPAGVEPHDYEPTAQDVAALQRVKVVIYNGAGLEPWVEDLLPQLPSTVTRVRTTEGLPLVEGTSTEPPPPGDHPVREAHREERVDPHVWLDPVLAQAQVDNILSGLIAADPAGRTGYEENAAGLKDELRALDDRFRHTLSTCKRRTFITSHAAFGYLARRYGLRMVAVSGLSPEAEPSPKRLREIVKLARAHGIRVIYFETLVSPRVAEVVAREVGAATRVLNPLEGLTAEEQQQGKTYQTVMEENLRALAAGLDC